MTHTDLVAKASLDDLTRRADDAHRQQSYCPSIEYPYWCRAEDEFRERIARIKAELDGDDKVKRLVELLDRLIAEDEPEPILATGPSKCPVCGIDRVIDPAIFKGEYCPKCGLWI